MPPSSLVMRFEWGQVEQAPARPFPCADGLRSYDGRGRRFVWRPHPSWCGCRCAFDVEDYDKPAPPILARGRDAHRFYAAWTAAEVLGKLADVPILVWLRTVGLPDISGEGVSRFEWCGRRFMLRTAKLASSRVWVTCGVTLAASRLGPGAATS